MNIVPVAQTHCAMALAIAAPVMPANAINGSASASVIAAPARLSQVCTRLRSSCDSRVTLALEMLPTTAAASKMRNGVTAGR